MQCCRDTIAGLQSALLIHNPYCPWVNTHWPPSAVFSCSCGSCRCCYITSVSKPGPTNSISKPPVTYSLMQTHPCMGPSEGRSWPASKQLINQVTLAENGHFTGSLIWEYHLQEQTSQQFLSHGFQQRTSMFKISLRTGTLPMWAFAFNTGLQSPVVQTWV